MDSRESPPIRIRALGRVEYEPTWQSMIEFTAKRCETTADELWCCEHPPIYTLGQAGKPEHLLHDNGIPLLKIDRGGQITYHGPGQVVIYLLVDLNRRGIKVKEFVFRIEQAIIDLLSEQGLAARRLEGAPGVYVVRGDGIAKIASLGLRIRRGCSYHGLSLNVAMDLSPFSAINPCGYAGLAVTQTSDLGIALDAGKLSELLAVHLLRQLEKA